MSRSLLKAERRREILEELALSRTARTVRNLSTMTPRDPDQNPLILKGAYEVLLE